MLDLHDDDFFTPELPEPQGGREAQPENRPSPAEDSSTRHTPQATGASEARQAASRENGRKSHGPKTPEGKARSSMNALKHGLTARQVCVGLEIEEEWDEFREEARSLLAPVGVIELEYADEWAASRWRLRRAYGIETLLFDTELARQESEPCEYKNMDAVARIGLAFKVAKQDIMALGRYASRIHRAGEHAHKMLLQLQRARQNEPTKWREPSGRSVGLQPGVVTSDAPILIPAVANETGRSTPPAPNDQNEPNAPIPIAALPAEPAPTCSAGSNPAVPGSQPGTLPEACENHSSTPSAPNSQNEPNAPIPAAAAPGKTAPVAHSIPEPVPVQNALTAVLIDLLKIPKPAAGALVVQNEPSVIPATPSAGSERTLSTRSLGQSGRCSPAQSA